MTLFATFMKNAYFLRGSNIPSFPLHVIGVTSVSVVLLVRKCVIFPVELKTPKELIGENVMKGRGIPSRILRF